MKKWKGDGLGVAQEVGGWKLENAGGYGEIF